MNEYSVEELTTRQVLKVLIADSIELSEIGKYVVFITDGQRTALVPLSPGWAVIKTAEIAK